MSDDDMWCYVGYVWLASCGVCMLSLFLTFLYM